MKRLASVVNSILQVSREGVEGLSHRSGRIRQVLEYVARLVESQRKRIQKGVLAWPAAMDRSSQWHRQFAGVSAERGVILFWRENKDDEFNRQASGVRQSPESAWNDSAVEDEFTQHRPDPYDDVPGSSPDQAPAPPPQVGTRGGPVSPPDSDTSVIAANTHWTGTLVSSGPVRIQGTVEGEITSESDIYVAEGASVEATLYAVNVTVAGSVDGEVQCTGRFEMLASGHLHGNVTAPTFVVHEGASVAGGLRMHSSADTSEDEARTTERQQ